MTLVVKDNLFVVTFFDKNQSLMVTKRCTRREIMTLLEDSKYVQILSIIAAVSNHEDR